MRTFFIVSDGVEREIKIPEFAASHELPLEVITAALDTVSLAVVGLLGVISAETPEVSQERFEQVFTTITGMRRDLGFNTGEGRS
jgi:hypothetical protein